MLSYYKALEERQNEMGEEGFTLIELLIVIVILAILAAVVVLSLGSITGNARSSDCISDAKSVALAVDAYDANGTGATVGYEVASATSVTNDLYIPTALVGTAWTTAQTTYFGSFSTATQAASLVPGSIASWPTDNNEYAISLIWQTTTGTVAPPTSTVGAGDVVIWYENQSTNKVATPAAWSAEQSSGTGGCTNL